MVKNFESRDAAASRRCQHLEQSSVPRSAVATPPHGCCGKVCGDGSGTLLCFVDCGTPGRQHFVRCVVSQAMRSILLLARTREAMGLLLPPTLAPDAREFLGRVREEHYHRATPELVLGPRFRRVCRRPPPQAGSLNKKLSSR